MGTPPPTSLTTPDLGSSHSGQEIYLATIETILSCPVSPIRQNTLNVY